MTNATKRRGRRGALLFFMAEKRNFDKWEPLIAAALVKKFEGMRLEAYLCPAGIPTIGYGHTRGVQLGTRIDADQADRYLTLDLERTARELRPAVKVPVSHGEFIGLMSFAFNVGAHNAAGSSVVKFLNAGKPEAAARAFLRWNKVSKYETVNGEKVKRLVESKGLTNRRKAEAEAFLS